MNQEQQREALAAFIEIHAPAVLALLPAGCHLSIDAPSRAWGEDFIVYELGQCTDGRHAKLHLFLRPDMGPPHCHFCDIESFGIVGSYIERTYHEESVVYHNPRHAGHRHFIKASTIHKIVALPDGPAWTLVFTGPIYREGRHHPELV